jgi:copper chaperone CopZ
VGVELKKLPGVASVEVSLNKGKALLKLEPGNSVQLREIVQKVRDKAFTPKEASVQVRGEVVSASGKLQLRVTGSSEAFDLTGPTGVLAEPSGTLAASKTVIIEGVVAAPKDRQYPSMLEVQSVKVSQ